MTHVTRRQFIRGDLDAVSPAGIVINPRESWATDRPPRGDLDEEDVRFLIVHHSASGNGHTTADAPALIRGYYDYHTSQRKGWPDIAYNFLIDAGGGIWEGRAGSLSGSVAGDATGGNQGFSQLVCMIGDFHTTEPSAESLDSLVLLLAWLAERHQISTSTGATATFVSRGSNLHPEGASVTTPTITGHRTMSRTTCPGDVLNTYVVGRLASDVEMARAPATTTSTRAAPSSTSVPSSTTVPTTTLPPTTSTTPVPNTSPVAAEPGDGRLIDPTGIGTVAGGVLLTGVGLLLWRQRRMKG